MPDLDPPGSSDLAEGPTRQEASPDFTLGRLDSQIRVEFDVVNERMTWLMTAQSFLFIAYANVWVGLSRGSGMILSKLAVIIPLIGIAMAILVRLSVWAAHSVVSQVKDERNRFEEIHPVYREYKISVHRKQKEHRLGNLPAQVLPFVFIVAWAGLLYWTM
jgi:hypothetical protein